MKITDEAIETVAGHFYTMQSGIAWSQIDPRSMVAQQYKLWAREALTSLPHLTDDGAGSGEPAVAADEAGSNPAGNPAPSSPHPKCSGHCYSLTEPGAGFIDPKCPVHGFGATPAIDREVIEQAIERAAVRADLAKYFLPGDMGKFVNEIMALFGGTS